MTSPLGAYQQMVTTTADPADLVLVLYDGAAAQLGRALRALETGKRDTFAHAIARAQAFVIELAGSLDHERGGEIAANLSRLYAFIQRHLGEGLRSESSEHVKTVLGLLSPLRDAFEQAIREQRRGPR
jgi:flagellar secretion chaperone FliS